MDHDLAFRRLLVALPIILAVGICTVDGLIWLISPNSTWLAKPAASTASSTPAP
jgi:hypothetical protein